MVKRNTPKEVNFKLINESGKKQMVGHTAELIASERIAEEGEGLVYIKFKIMVLIIIKIIVNEVKGNSRGSLILQVFQ